MSLHQILRSAGGLEGAGRTSTNKMAIQGKRRGKGERVAGNIVAVINHALGRQDQMLGLGGRPWQDEALNNDWKKMMRGM